MGMKHSKLKCIALLTALALVSLAGWAVASDTNGFNYPARQLLRAAWKASWSPDSKHLAFTRQGGGIAVLEGTATNQAGVLTTVANGKILVFNRPRG